MKKTFLLSLATLGSIVALGQNTAIMTRQGSTHKASVAQEGTGNTSVVSQSGTGASNNVTIVQSGTNHVATIGQGSPADGTSDSTNSVITSQADAGQTILYQTNAGSTLRIDQSDRMPVTTQEKSQKKQPNK